MNRDRLGDVALRVARRREVVFERVGDGACGVDDALGGGLDEFDVAAGPVCDVGDRVLGGVDAGVGADEEGDAFGFDFHAFSRRAACKIAGWIVEPDVSEFVGEGLGALGRLEVGPDRDGAGDPVGAAVGWGAVPVVEREARRAHLLRERGPEVLRTLAPQELWRHLWVGGWCDERGFVEYAHGFEADQYAARRLFPGGFVE